MEAAPVRIPRIFLLVVVLMVAVVARAGGASCPSAAAPVPPVNLNTADADTLAAGLKGVGKAKAEAIVKWREVHGRFSRIEQLDDVKGIGPGIIGKNRDRIVLKD